jgi:hypothetical protein
LNQVAAIACGSDHALALKQDGTVWAWGRNTNGLLGDGTTNHRTLPTQVTGLTSIVALACNNTHNLALKADGTVWVWGNNTYGQLGLGTVDNGPHPVPTMIPGLNGVVSVSAGSMHSLALRYDGAVRAWGSNTYGQLGMGYVTNQNYPSPITTLDIPGVGGLACFFQQGFIGGLDDGLADLRRQAAGCHVGPGGALLDDHRGPDKSRVRFESRNGEIMHGPRGLRAARAFSSSRLRSAPEGRVGRPQRLTTAAAKYW